MSKSEPRTMERRALRLEQPGGHEVFLFTLRPSEILEVADISRIARDDAGRIIGYQRQAVRHHINDIRTYLDGDDVVFPNSIILAIDGAYKWRSSRGPNASDGLAAAGRLELIFTADRKPAWIVDGQQRAFALADIARDDLPIPVNAFVADSVDLQRDQFIRVNNTKPLPRGLVTELLPEVVLSISSRLSAKKIPSALCDQLNLHEDSPFNGLIKRPSTPKDAKPKPVVTDTSIVKMLEDSLRSSSGCLFPFRNLATSETDFDAIWAVLTTYWSAVRNVFPQAWGLPATKSRLMHGAGIRAMGKLMDKVMGSINPSRDDAMAHIEKELRLIEPVCRWTSGTWPEIGLSWNEVQNTPNHVRDLSNFLIRSYVTTKMAA